MSLQADLDFGKSPATKSDEFSEPPTLIFGKLCCNFYRTRVRSLAMLVSNSLTHYLTDSCLVLLIDVTLPREDAKSKLVDVVTLADEDRVGNNLLQISNLRFGQKAKLLFGL